MSSWRLVLLAGFCRLNASLFSSRALSWTQLHPSLAETSLILGKMRRKTKAVRNGQIRLFGWSDERVARSPPFQPGCI
jgi:hypothetical protein